MKKYKSHKVVEASKILNIGYMHPDGTQTLFLEDGEVIVSDPYMTKHKPHGGGYYVKYEDGYESFSPAEAFESGYAEVGEKEILNTDNEGLDLDLMNTRLTCLDHAVKLYSSSAIEFTDLKVSKSEELSMVVDALVDVVYGKKNNQPQED